MSEDSYWTQGAIIDRAKSLAVQERIAVALERIADRLAPVEVKEDEVKVGGTNGA